jgi:hypothetical protein
MRRLLLRHRTGKGGGFDIIELDPPSRPYVMVDGLSLPEVTAFLLQASQVIVERSRETVRLVGRVWKSLP